MTTRDGGAVVTIEGSEAEVANLLARLNGEAKDMAASQTAERPRVGKPTPMGLISDLISEGFFREPRELGSVRTALKEKGHFYPVTTLSPLMLRLVRRKDLRRLKEKKRWTYVG
jgi:hypothetical protein